MTLMEIHKEILLKEQNEKKTLHKGESSWIPECCEDYSVPEFHIPESRAKAAQRRKLSKVLAFVKRAQSIRLNTGCTIMPIPTTNKNMIAIAGSVANASNLIKFMCEIGLISIESDKYRFNSRRAGGNFSKKYRYYFENEVKLIEYC